MDIASSFTVELEQQSGYQFLVKFDWPNIEPLLLDEPPPLGQQTGPNASRILAAAVANCLTASFVFCLSKARIETKGVKSSARVDLVRNEKGRLRLGQIHVAIDVVHDGDDNKRFERCGNLFEDFCVVTESVRHGIPVDVSVSINGVALLTSN